MADQSHNQNMTGGECLARMLAAHNVGPMFGMGGFQLLPFYDAARRLGLRHNLINDERCAVFAADAYAKVSGRVGLADALLGDPAVILLDEPTTGLDPGQRDDFVAMISALGQSHAVVLSSHVLNEVTQLATRVVLLDTGRVRADAPLPELGEALGMTAGADLAEAYRAFIAG